MGVSGKLNIIQDDDKSILFSVDVKDVINKTELVLPVRGRLIFVIAMKIDYEVLIINCKGDLKLEKNKDYENVLIKCEKVLGILLKVEHHF